MYLSEREEEEVTVAICKKKLTEDGGSEWIDGKVCLKTVAKLNKKRLMLERLEACSSTDTLQQSWRQVNTHDDRRPCFHANLQKTS